MMKNLVMAAVLVVVGGAVVGAQAPAGGRKVKAPASRVVNGGATDGAMRTQGFTGDPSSLVACTGGTFNTVHPLGASTRGTRIRVDVQSGDNIDPTAALTILQMGGTNPTGTARAALVFDDDSGGNLDPRIDTTLEYDANVVLSVGSFGGEFGCYVVKIQVTPAP